MSLHRRRANLRRELPFGLTPVLSSSAVIGLVRYQEGPLCYDELVIGCLARKGLRIGMYVDRIWVDSEASLAGGRRIWGFPKEMAHFSWKGDIVTIEDREGHIATISANQAPARGPSLPVIAPGFGIRDGELVFSRAVLFARLRSSSIQILQWSPRFDFIDKAPWIGFDATPFRMSLAAPKVLVPLGAGRSAEHGYHRLA